MYHNYFIFSSAEVHETGYSVSTGSAVLFFHFTISVTYMCSDTDLADSSEGKRGHFYYGDDISESVTGCFFYDISASFFASSQVSVAISFFLASPRGLQVNSGFPGAEPFGGIYAYECPYEFSTYYDYIESTSDIFTCTYNPSNSLRGYGTYIVYIRVSRGGDLTYSTVSSDVSIYADSYTHSA